MSFIVIFIVSTLFFDIVFIVCMLKTCLAHTRVLGISQGSGNFKLETESFDCMQSRQNHSVRC